MAEKTNVEWTDSTVNFWWGCTHVGPGCDHCYAETWSKRTGESIWGAGVPRRKIKGAVALLNKLHNQRAAWAADRWPPGTYRRRRVFVQSMSDLFDLEVPVEWFAEAWATITACHGLTIQIVTKRVSAVQKRLTEIGATWPAHAGLLITVCNQAEADRDVPRLLALRKALGIPWIGLSIEPMLGDIDLIPYLPLNSGGVDYCLHDESRGLDWVICGGESGPHARPMHPNLPRSLRDQCSNAGVPFFFKQWGEWLPLCQSGPICGMSVPRFYWDDSYVSARVGKRTAGRLLDGVTHDGMVA